MTDHEPAEITHLLSGWLPQQRWFAGKDRPVDSLRVLSAILVREAAPRVWHLLVAVGQQGETTYYQVPVSIRQHREDRLDHVLIGETSAGIVYDALHDKEATSQLLERIANEDSIDGLSFHRERGAKIPVGEQSLVLTAEQSNTSLAYGDVALLKVFRRIRLGRNPDVELHDVLTRAECPYVARLLGWIDGRWTDPVTGEEMFADLAMLQAFLVTGTDGWQLATASVRDLFAEADLHANEVGGDFAGEARRLGQATAEVHTCLAQVLPTGEYDSSGLRELAGDMRRRLNDALETVPELEPYGPGLQAAFDDLAALDRRVPTQRIHGDLHLGQVMRTSLGWKLLDFEGEPEKPLAERVALDSPLRDVAGMLRSFDYAAQHLLVADHPGDPQITYRAEEWAERNRGAFCDGYADASGHDPREEATLLRAYETDKAIYEVVYEAHNRPEWLPIPLAAVERLAAGVLER